MGEGKAVSTKNLIATNLMVAGDSRVGKVSDGLLEKNGLRFVDSSICNSCEQQNLMYHEFMAKKFIR